jgi:hypothetical protein
MDIYIIDIDRLENDPSDPEDYNLADQLYLHRDILRGCTNNWFRMKKYYDFLTNLTKGLVELKTFKFTNIEFHGIRTGLEFDGDIIDSGQLSSIALSLYNNGNMYDTSVDMPWTKAATMPILLEHPLENGECFVCSEAMNELFDEHSFSECEMIFIAKLSVLFLRTNNYIFPMRQNEALMDFREMILEELPNLMNDPYTGSLRFTVNPCELQKMWVTTYEFLR